MLCLHCMGSNALHVSSGLQIFKYFPMKSVLGITSMLGVACAAHDYWKQYKEGIITYQEFWEKLACSAKT